MKERTEKCKISGHFRHETEELFPNYDEAIICLWKDLPSTVLERIYKHEGVLVSLKLDVKTIAPLLIQRKNSLSKFKENSDSVPDDWWKVFFKEARCNCNVSILGTNDLSQHGWYAKFFVESHFYDLFLILNLALPGSANFSSLKLSSADKEFSTRLNLSSFYLEEAWIKSQEDEWPLLREFSVEVVSDWFWKVRSGFNQIPESSIERSLFALLHICESNGGPEDIIWLFYAMESLFDTKPGENFAALYDRLCLILNPPEKIARRLKKELRILYDYRSSFVHGGLSVIHPHHMEVMDRRVDRQYGNTIEISQRWVHILVACLQRFIHEGWTKVQFQTRLMVNES